MIYCYNTELYHHGIKGMKWGVRHYQNKDGTYTALGKKRRRDDYSEDYKRAQELRNRDIRTLSNKELNDLNNRMQLENNYKNLKSSGKKKSDGIISRFGKQTTSILIGMAASAAAKWVWDQFKVR